MVDARALAVAVRAQEIALASEIELPDDLELWRLAGGRPEATARAGEPEELGAALEQAHGAEQRHRTGVHYTPRLVAEGIAARALDGRSPTSVCDLCCGGGALLLAAGRAMEAAGVRPADAVARLWAADVDPLAVATTEAALTLWAAARPPAEHLAVADTLLDPPDWKPVDVVVGNPPFLSQLDATTTRSSADNARLRASFGAAMGAYTDTAALFLLRSAALCRPGGRVVMIQPQSVLAARDAAGVRDLLAARATLQEVWVPSGATFEAAVDACAVVLDLVPGEDHVPWSSHLAAVQGVPSVELAGPTTLGDEASTGAPFRAEYYGLAPHVHEQHDRPRGRPLLTTGLVDIGRSWWGERPARMANRSWRRPVVDCDALDGRAAAWAARTAGPKVVVATQTRVIEVLVDEDGSWLPSVPLVVVWAHPNRLWPLAAALASPPVTAWASARTAGSALSRGAIKVSAALLRQVPLPVDDDAWIAGTAALRSGDAAEFADAMTAAYGCGHHVAEWWLGRSGSAWSAAPVSR